MASHYAAFSSDDDAVVSLFRLIQYLKALEAPFKTSILYF